jgi:predicted nucleic acid-binding protein
MIVVSDTSALNYLILIGEDRVLPTLFNRVAAPPAVIAELKRAKAPIEVKNWVNNCPAWLEIRSPGSLVTDSSLGPGESEAISLALELKADLLLVDERDGTAEAKRRGLAVTGTLGVIEMAAAADLLSLSDAIAALRKTTFRGSKDLIDDILARYERRRTSSS